MWSTWTYVTGHMWPLAQIDSVVIMHCPRWRSPEVDPCQAKHDNVEVRHPSWLCLYARSPAKWRHRRRHGRSAHPRGLHGWIRGDRGECPLQLCSILIFPHPGSWPLTIMVVDSSCSIHLTAFRADFVTFTPLCFLSRGWGRSWR
jgi:hypothetical protein